MPTSPLDHCLHLNLLGGFDARLEHRPVPGFSYNKMRALLAYLAVEREQDHNRESLSELLWGGQSTQSARDNLRRTLSNLRRALEAPSGLCLFAASKHTLRFIPDAYIDVLDFQGKPSSLSSNTISHAERVIGLYKGEFLAGLGLPDSPDFEYWLQIQREALHRHALALLEQLADFYGQAGDYGKALQFALRHTELEPWNENTHRQIMRFYALNNQASAATQQYEICCRLLKNDYGTTPDAATCELFGRIQSGTLRPERSPVLATANKTNAERRQVTVLYCELSAAASDDPDEAMALLHEPLARCMDIIRQHTGHTEQVHGGGLLAYFGYPQAHEHAARHAVQAALAITDGQTGAVDIRTSIHTGLIITSGGTSVPDTVGRTSRIALQLLNSASPYDIVISQETHCLVDGYFAYQPMEAQGLLGVARPVEIFKVLGASGALTRLEAATQLTPLSGRKLELAKLMALWAGSVAGHRHILLIQGDAGIGKSRLLHTLKRQLTNYVYSLRELRCFPEFSQSPFYPLIAMLESLFGFDKRDLAETKSAKLADYLQAHYPSSAQDAIPLLAQLLSLPPLAQYPLPDYSPQKQKGQIISILLNLLQALASQQPVLLIVEDLHWIDPSTLELLTLFVKTPQAAPILALLTARPEFMPPWQAGLSPCMNLGPLIESEVADMVIALNKDIPAPTLQCIIERADGVPLFVEEMAKMVSLDKHTEIPTTLHDLLAARMDTLGEAKHTAQLAATLGREFASAILGQVSPYPADVLAGYLQALQEIGLLFQVDGNHCQFKHALIQEAAYQSQTKPVRQATHSRIAQVLIHDFPESANSQPELVARHLASAGEMQTAIVYWHKAGQRAILNSSNLEAIAHCRAGLEGLMGLIPDAEVMQWEITLNLNLGTALIAARGYGSSEACQAYQQALALSESIGDNTRLFNALWGMWLTSSSRIGHGHSLELAHKLLDQAEHNQDVLQLQQAHYAMGNSLFWTGQPEPARRHLEQAIALYLPEHHEPMVSQFGENICVSSGALLLLVLWLLGKSSQAQAVSARTVALARQINHPFSLGFALNNAAMLNRWLGRVEETELLAQEAIALSRQFGLSFWLGMGVNSYGWALAMQGQSDGIAAMQESLEAVDAIMSGAKILFLAPLLEAYIALERYAEALALANEALAVVTAKNDRFFESEFYRLKGVCLLALAPAQSEAAGTYFRQALSISRQQGAKALELRAANSLQKLGYV